jgi:hypothetical protein
VLWRKASLNQRNLHIPQRPGQPLILGLGRLAIFKTFTQKPRGNLGAADFGDWVPRDLVINAT